MFTDSFAGKVRSWREQDVSNREINRRVDEAFEDYLKAFWRLDAPGGSIRRQEFYDEWELPLSLIDWDRWREESETA